ncbi:hypothetical protein Btru_069099 [Bulinus truncatus]|nr:hypothetical protein Btru_069099 [Bulinus truncatus]
MQWYDNMRQYWRLMLVVYMTSLCNSLASGVRFGQRVTSCQTSNPAIFEASGLALSRVFPNVAYVQNDKEGVNEIFALNMTDCSTIATFLVNHTINWDWEDLTYGPCLDDCKTNPCRVDVVPSRYCIYIADTGARYGEGPVNDIYVIREPSILQNSVVDTVGLIKFTWNEPDAETLMISPDGRLFIVSKVTNGQGKIAEIPSSAWNSASRIDLASGQTATLKINTTTRDPEGGDISPDGNSMIIVGEQNIFYYSVTGGDVIKAVNDQVPKEVDTYQRVLNTQGIAWSTDGTSIYIFPEGKNASLYMYPVDLSDPVDSGAAVSGNDYKYLQVLISDEIKDVILTVNYVSICGTLSVFGLAANVMNVIVFLRLGLNDAVNVSLMSLAVADVFSMIFLLLESACFNPLFQNIGLPFALMEVQFIVGGWPHICFTRTVSWITAFITFERCICIALPLKVKSIITATRTKCFVVMAFLIVAGSAAPEFYVNQFVWKFYPDKNVSLIGLHFVEDRDRFENVTFPLNNVIMQYLAFSVVLVCTVILVVKLNEKTKWRNVTTRGDSAAAISNKDRKVIKMVSFVSAAFIVSYLPSSILFMAMAIKRDFHPSGYFNIFHVTWSFAFVLEAVNSTITIVIYYKLSSKFKRMFDATFSCAALDKE